MNASADRGPEISLISPLFCERGNVFPLLEALHHAVAAACEDYEYILVDDGSSDGTWEEILEAAESYPQLRACQLSRNFGKEAAICAGLEICHGRAAIVIDGDLQHPPKLIGEMVRLWRDEGFEIVEAVKRTRGRETIITKAGSGLFYAMMKRLAGFDLRGASDMKLLDRRVIEAWSEMGDRNVFFRGMVAWLGFRKTEIFFAVAPRQRGRTGWTKPRLIALGLRAVTSFSSGLLHVVTVCGALFMVFAVTLAAHTLYMVVSNQAISGFATVILLNLIVGGVLMFSLGVIGQYISQIYDEVKNRPRWVVRERLR